MIGKVNYENYKTPLHTINKASCGTHFSTQHEAVVARNPAWISNTKGKNYYGDSMNRKQIGDWIFPFPVWEETGFGDNKVKQSAEGIGDFNSIFKFKQYPARYISERF